LDLLDPRDPAARSPLQHWLAVQRAFALRPEKLPAGFCERRAAGPDLAALGLAPLPRGLAERWARRLAAADVRLVPMPSAFYPEGFRRLVDAPPVLAVQGNPGLLRARCVAIVEARACTAYGRRVARSLSAALVRAGLVVVSGLARGIDAAAHEGALAAGGATLAFQACGPDRVYPPIHRPLAARIAASGAVVTEHPPETPPRAPYFPLRNRLISSISEAVVVVEARQRSGSLVTARHAADQGVAVWAVPGPLDAATSAGPHSLLRDGAHALFCAEDLLHDLGLPPSPAARRRPVPTEDPIERRILACLAREAASRDQLVARLALPAGPLQAALMRLELAGKVEEDRDGRLRCLSPASSPWL